MERDYTAASMERTHRWLDRCVSWCRENAPDGQLLYGIVQGGVYEDLRAESTAYVAGAGVDGIAIGGSLGQEKEQMREVVGWALAGLPEEPPRHLLGIGDVDDIVHAVGAGIDTFDCATPTRLARHGTALVHDPDNRWRLDLTKGAHRTSREPIEEDCPCPACRDHTRGYLHYLSRIDELTAKRLLTLHNLTFMERLMRRLRDGIEAGDYAGASASALQPHGAHPAFADVVLQGVAGVVVLGGRCAPGVRLPGHGHQADDHQQVADHPHRFHTSSPSTAG